MRTAFGIAYFSTVAAGGALLGATAIVGCSSESPTGPGSGGTSAGGTSSSAGAGGSTAGSSGSAGTGGAACVGDPPVTPNKVCADIPSQKKGDASFTVSSPDFTSCGEIPKTMTCDGHDFGTGASPQFTWSTAPAGTLSFAVVFKDISLSNDLATERFGYHWVMWDIPPTVTGLPAGMTGGYASTEVPGAHQWSTLGSYGFFTPCPNPFPNGAPQFMCSLTQDSYALTVYALKVAKIDNLPAAVNTTTSMPAVSGWNWVVNMGHYIESLDAVAVAEYRGTSKAWAAQFVSPNAAAFPCSGSAGGAGGAASGAGGAASGAGGAASGAGGAGGTSGSGGASGGASGSGGTGGSSGASGSAGTGGAATMCLK